MLLVRSMPPKTSEHYENKILLHIRWWRERGYPKGIPDAVDYALEAKRKAPSWRRVCKTLLRNDYWCKGLGFTQQKSAAYDKYLEQSTHPSYLTDLNTLFSEADILSLHIPLTHETQAMINQSFLKKFSKPIFFINVSRGEIAPLGEIRQALANGLIRKSALDVLECEKFNLMNAEQLENFKWL